MKLNNSNFDQTSFSHKRVVFSLLWLRSKRFVPAGLRVSFKDMLFLYLEHYYFDAFVKFKFNAKRIINKIKRFKG